MRHVRPVIALTWLPVFATLSPEPADAQRFVLEAAASGGFAGIEVPEVKVQPLFRIASDGTAIPRSDSLSLLANQEFVWRPAVSTGLVARYLLSGSNPDEETLGVGIGGHMVMFAAGADARIKLAPALTAHFGSLNMQVFIGYIFSASDEIRLPGIDGAARDGDQIVVPVGTDPDQFVLGGVGNGPTIFVGLIIGGLSVTKLGAGGS
jgi:hypothetical protein